MKHKGGWILGLGIAFFTVSFIFLVIAAVLFSENSGLDFDKKGDIAVIEIKGAIMDSKDVVEDLDRLEKNDDIPGVILRIDSPGGAVGPSQEIYQAVLRLRKKKKVIASLGSVAASGGYYIAVAADKIIANPGTITGSIGVLMDYMNVEELLKFFKVDARILTAGKMKDVGSPLKPLSPEDREFLQSILDNMHAQFKKAVQDGRKFDKAKIDQLADGRVFTGEQALALGLVDQLGNQQVAVDVAKQMLKIDGEPKLVYPKKKDRNLLELLIGENVESRITKLYYSLREGRVLYYTRGVLP